LGIKAAADYGQGVHKAAAAIFKIWREFQEAGSGPEARRGGGLHGRVARFAGSQCGVAAGPSKV